MTITTAAFLKLAKKAAAIASDKKSDDILLINVSKHSTIADYMVIATVESQPQMKAVMDTIVTTFREQNDMAPVHSEWKSDMDWSVLDYGGLVIHVMLPKARGFYSLEKLWPDARKTRID